jgi:hypothetical protein
VNFWINQFSLKNGEVLLGATRSWRRKFLRKFSEKKMSFCKKIGSPGIEGKNVHCRLSFEFLDEKWGFFPGNNPQ